MNPNEKCVTPSIEWVEETLRELPTPEVPMGLKNRLLATVPPSNTKGNRNQLIIKKRIPSIVFAIAACLVVLLSGSFLLVSRNSVSLEEILWTPSLTSDYVEPERTLEVHFLGETDPCNILDPLHF